MITYWSLVILDKTEKDKEEQAETPEETTPEFNLVVSEEEQDGVS